MLNTNNELVLEFTQAEETTEEELAKEIDDAVVQVCVSL